GTSSRRQDHEPPPVTGRRPRKVDRPFGTCGTRSARLSESGYRKYTRCSVCAASTSDERADTSLSASVTGTSCLRHRYRSEIRPTTAAPRVFAPESKTSSLVAFVRHTRFGSG